MKIQSIASQKREKQRTSPKTLEFKAKVCDLLEKAKPDVAYAVKRDLSVMTNMPFYKDRPTRKKLTLKPINIVGEYVKFFCTCSDKDFIKSLLKKLSVNQNQTIRKVAPKIGKANQIWEHAIPTKVFVDELIKMILNENITELQKLLKIYCRAGQRGITKEQDKLLKQYKTSMPHGWDWRDENVDPLARHREVGINH